MASHLSPAPLPELSSACRRTAGGEEGQAPQALGQVRTGAGPGDSVTEAMDLGGGLVVVV